MNRASSVSSQPSSNSTQFKHTFIWNNIIDHLKRALIDDGSSSSSDNSTSGSQQGVTYSHRLRKQHSRFVTGGMLLIKQNLLSSTGLTPNSDCIENVCFTGAQCVDIVYEYLTRKDQVTNFERQVTREKVTKLCQTIMDTGVFEPVSRSCSRFDDTLLKFYRFKPEEKLSVNTQSEGLAQKRSESKDDIVLMTKEKAKSHLFGRTDVENSENNLTTRNIVGMAFNKCKAINKANMTNTKLKRKVTSMKRSSTIQTLMPVEKLPETIKKPTETLNNSRTDILQTIDNNTIDQLNTQISKSKLNDKPLKATTAGQDLLLSRRITREVVVEKLLCLIDLPVVEQLLVTNECNDIDYRELVEKSKDKNYDENQNILVTSQRSLAILTQTHDLSRCNTDVEWKRSAIDCLEFIEPSTAQLNKNLMKELELYNKIKDYYTLKRECFLDDSFQPLFVHILSFLRSSQYMKALETVNYGTLLLLKQTQAELKRLLKFLYLTANFTSAPRLAENKQNNSILLNHFASCLFNTKLIEFEESRLILNFMLNNFDHLFQLGKPLEETIHRRCIMAQKYGREEALIEKLYCKRLTAKEYIESSKDQTTKALVDLINHIVDDPQISLKQKKLKLKALQRIHPEVYQKYFSDLF